jgi:hypothetical protein
MSNQADYREALASERDGDWDAAHRIVQAIETPTAYAIHAYLHRKEGDIDNAGYWYARADLPPVSGDLAAEWQALWEALPIERLPEEV